MASVRLMAVAGAAVAVVAPNGTANAATMRVYHPPFTVQSSVPYAPLASVSAISATNAWAVGRNDGSVLTEHWDGQKWSSVGLPSGPCDVFESSCQFTSVSADSATDMIAVGDGILNTYPTWTAAPLAYRWTGSAWQPMRLPAGLPYTALDHVKAFSPTDAWAVGTGSVGSQNAAIVTHWNGTSWTQAATPFTTSLNLSMNAVAGTSPTDVWAVGQAQSSGYHNKIRHSVALHYDGTSWTQVAVPDTGGLIDVAAISPADAWALSWDGNVLHWDGTAWTIKTKFLGGSAVVAVSSTDVWIAGVYTNNTLSLARYNGSAWNTVTAPTGIGAPAGGAALASGALWFSGSNAQPDGTTAPAVLGITGG
jgi:hypothetical protein